MSSGAEHIDGHPDGDVDPYAATGIGSEKTYDEAGNWFGGCVMGRDVQFWVTSVGRVQMAIRLPLLSLGRCCLECWQWFILIPALYISDDVYHVISPLPLVLQGRLVMPVTLLVGSWTRLVTLPAVCGSS
jgi:hypothetical protein